ncbi:hypothetical protein ACFWIW_10890 [Amycolatopsis sp. NPDC058340]|uniref:hypothetical protein n=1 Tax=Amycolatopsis sp. NPDC058340 TaxID=3346453 RepID=UPI0036496F3F
MNQPTHDAKARDFIERAEAALKVLPESAKPGEHATVEQAAALVTVAASIATAHAVLAHLDALALPAPGTGDVILDAARKLTDELDAVQDHDHGGLTSGPDDHAQAVVPGAPVAPVAPETGSPMSPGAGNGSGEIRADLEALIVDTAGCAWNRPPMEVADAILAAGWRPPLPDVSGEDFAPDDESPVALVAAYLKHFVGGPGRASLAASGLDVLGLLMKPAPDGDTEDARVREIRAVLAPLGLYATGPDHLADALRRIRAIVGGELPPARRVFFPYDTVPAGVAVQSATGDIARYAVAVQLTEQEGWDGPGVEIQSLTAKEWQAAVDQAGRERREREQVHAALLGAELGADVAREHGVLPDEDDIEESTSDTEHADGCTGCDGPGIVPCAADQVIGNTAFRDGQPIKDLEAGRG